MLETKKPCYGKNFTFVDYFMRLVFPGVGTGFVPDC